MVHIQGLPSGDAADILLAIMHIIVVRVVPVVPAMDLARRSTRPGIVARISVSQIFKGENLLTRIVEPPKNRRG